MDIESDKESLTVPQPSINNDTYMCNTLIDSECLKPQPGNSELFTLWYCHLQSKMELESPGADSDKEILLDSEQPHTEAETAQVIAQLWIEQHGDSHLPKPDNKADSGFDTGLDVCVFSDSSLMGALGAMQLAAPDNHHGQMIVHRYTFPFFIEASTNL